MNVFKRIFINQFLKNSCIYLALNEIEGHEHYSSGFMIIVGIIAKLVTSIAFTFIIYFLWELMPGHGEVRLRNMMILSMWIISAVHEHLGYMYSKQINS